MLRTLRALLALLPLPTLAGAERHPVVEASWHGARAYLPYPYNPADGREDAARPLVRGTRGGGHHNITFRCAR
jgi:hypothetical protein